MFFIQQEPFATAVRRSLPIFCSTARGANDTSLRSPFQLPNKVVTTAFEPEDSLRVHAAAKSLALPVPYIGLCLTETGKLSRVLNERYTPVTHENLPFTAAPGQMSSKEIMHHRTELGLCLPRSFFLFGSPISASPSPDMHNAGFRTSGLPHEYSLCEGEDPAVMVEALSRPDFGGASVTIPHKQNVLTLLDEVSEAAKTIGAVNTVIVGTDPETGARRLRGDNTDWLGILRPVKARLEASGWEQGRGGVAIVVGAGGAAMGALFAMQRLGLEVVVYNRTPAKAEELASRFGGAAVSELDVETLKNACGAAAVDVVVSTIPAAAEFTLPEYLLESKVGSMAVFYCLCRGRLSCISGPAATTIVDACACCLTLRSVDAGWVMYCPSTGCCRTMLRPCWC